MKSIPLYILDEYAKRLSSTLVNKLYEHKCGKKFEKVLNENTPASYRLYLNAFTIADECEQDKTQFIMTMTDKYPSLMESLSYKISSDAITFSTKDRATYGKLISTIINEGISEGSLEGEIDKKF